MQQGSACRISSHQSTEIVLPLGDRVGNLELPLVVIRSSMVFPSDTMLTQSRWPA